MKWRHGAQAGLLAQQVHRAVALEERGDVERLAAPGAAQGDDGLVAEAAEGLGQVAHDAGGGFAGLGGVHRDDAGPSRRGAFVAAQDFRRGRVVEAA